MTHLYMVSLDLKKNFHKYRQRDDLNLKSNNRQSCEQVISLELVNIFASD